MLTSKPPIDIMEILKGAGIIFLVGLVLTLMIIFK